MSAPRLQLLDTFAFEAEGRSSNVPFVVQRLMAFLGLRGLSHRSRIAGTLWPDVDEPLALASLRTAVWRLKKVSPDCVRCEGLSLGLHPSVTVDTHEQETFVTTLLNDNVDDPQWLRAGLSHLRQGDLLPGWHDDWIVVERERMSLLRLRALENAARILTRHREFDAALDLALEAVRMEPLRETAQAVLMSVYVAEGNVAHAMHQYDSFSLLLHRELGIAPTAGLSRILPRRSDP
jgi:DNA-binding SARP family transcriptional activator